MGSKKKCIVIYTEGETECEFYDRLLDELKRINQKRLLTKDEVIEKILEIIQNDNIKSGEIIRMDDNNE